MLLSAREKMLIALLGAALVAAGSFFAYRALRGYEERIEGRIQSEEAALRQVAVLREELARLRAAPRVEPLRQPLLGYLERLAREAGLGDRLQLNLMPQDRAKDLEAVEVKLDALTLDEMVGIVHALENAQPPLFIDQFEVTPSFRSRELLRVTLRVLAQK